MEITNFLTWSIVIAAIAAFGLGSMIWAYVGPGSRAIIFENPISTPPSLPPSDEAAKLADFFRQGHDAYQAGKHRQAIDKFSQAIQLAPTFAQAYHNRGLAWANLRQDDNAVANLVRAGEIYAQQGNEEGITIVKENLLALKARKQAREEN